MFKQAIAKYYEHLETAYVTANVDKKLTAALRRKTTGLPIKINIIEDAAQNVKQYIGNELFDIIAVQAQRERYSLCYTWKLAQVLKWKMPTGLILFSS